MMTRKMSGFWQGVLVIVVGLACLGIAMYGRNYHQHKVREERWHSFAGTYYAYVADNGDTHKVRLTIPQNHRVATLRIVDNTTGMSTHVSKVNRLKINQRRKTMTAIGYPGTPADHYQHVGSTINLTTEGQTQTYYRQGTPQQEKHEDHFQH